MSSVIIRSFEPRDRSAVRDICCDTADRGGPVESVFSDREIVAVALTSYYLDYEPASASVAESDGRIVGYLLGCLNTRRCRRLMAWRIVPRVAWRGILHGLLWRRQSWRLLRAGVMTWRRGGFGAQASMTRYPAHLHINLLSGYRGNRIGQQLVERFLGQVQANGVPGVHAVVRQDNPVACRFFERLGFTALERRHETVVYAKTI